ncbi:hypothetical protein ABOM_009751 [Aspergillus bombycis]|uniref:Uncharacterized protein n=1 Tax=Aspergillus bombycis TaxID=109264 RepID=A0A1F7ZPA2_9EURO|nr:hypothetical protein ABOM_009751 [Aspergillus bombycis]OGM41284.1 hypothetical protein ABOM_009751 [Aspergillus bombycis]
MKTHHLVLFSLVAIAASAPVPEEDKRSSILDGYESAGDMDFPNARKNEPTKEQDRMYNGIWIPHTIDWRFPPRATRSETETDLSSGGAEETGDNNEDQ